MSAIATAQAQALIARVRDEAAAAIDELRAHAQAECHSLRQQARRDARQRLHAAVAEKRRRITERCRAADIQCEEQRRVDSFRLSRELAERALAQLPDMLATRWQAPDLRTDWCATALATAVRILRSREWTIEAANGMSDIERQAVETLAATHGATIRQWRESPATAGLRIGAGDTWIDATTNRLLADRTALVSNFLAELQDARSTP
ncbi:MAG: hypothetical protein WCH32_15390 [Pseudomonadota bacterium]